MEMKKEVAEQENICTALLTAGVVLSMACLKHFSSVSSLIEQWRSWVFLVLNLVLIAVYFTSTRSSSCHCVDQELKTRCGGRLRMRGKKTKKAKRVCSDFVIDLNKFEGEIKSCVEKEVVEETKRVCSETEENEKDRFFIEKTAQKEDDQERERRVNVVTDDDDEEDGYIEPGRLSNEELNERVEAFITMFRQHLVLDARRGRDRDRNRMEVSKHREAETMRSNGKGFSGSDINVSAREVTCSV